MTVHCGGKKSNGEKCQQPAGWGTEHLGEGRCKLHGGASPRGEASPQYKHGRYSRFLNASLRDKMNVVDDENPLDLLPELQVQRALLADYAERFKDGYRMTANDVQYLMGWTAEIGRSVERIVKLRNDTALTAAEVALIAARIPEVVAKFIHDPNQQRAFIDALFAGVGVAETANIHQLGASAGSSR